VRTAADFLIENASVVVTCAGPAPRRGPAQRDTTPLHDAVVAAHQGVIVYVGPAGAVPDELDLHPDAVRIDARGCTVVPGFVDPHTHVIFAGDRRDELRRRLLGASYESIAAEGGGISKTVTLTRAASEEALADAARVRLDEMLAAGTTTCEAKSGYGLTTESELTQLRVIRTLNRSHEMDLVATFLGAHEVPVEYRSRRADYVTAIIEDMIPRVAGDGLADWCDVFCDTGFFTPEESIAILDAGRRAGLMPRIHADQLACSGGCQVAATVGARSADHLLYADEAGADALAASGVCATLLPSAAFYLKLGRFAPARMLIDRGVPVALATDLNPGGGFSPSMPFAMALACFGMHMTLEESLIASTLNAAWSLDRADTVGSLEPGKLMDAVVIRGGLVELLRVGSGTSLTVIKRGKVVAAAHENRGMASYSTLTVTELLDAFASSEPVPGGGSASALAGAVGVSLLMMVAGLPKTRTGTPEERAALGAAAARLRPLRDVLTTLVDRDSKAYTLVLEAFRLPKGTDAEKTIRRDAIDRAMRAATDTPLETMRACEQALGQAVAVAANVVRSAASDAGVGIELLRTALRGAALNVDTNLGDVKDQEYVERVRVERTQLEEASLAAATRAAAFL